MTARPPWLLVRLRVCARRQRPVSRVVHPPSSILIPCSGAVRAWFVAFVAADEPEVSAAGRTAVAATASPPSDQEDTAAPPKKRMRVCTAADKQPDFVGWVCSECGATFATTVGCVAHLAAHRGYTWRCGECGTEFPRRSSLLAHLWAHLPKRFPCDECIDKFVQKKDLMLHRQRCHTTNPPPRYDCEQCESTYSTRSNLNKHVRAKHA